MRALAIDLGGEQWGWAAGEFPGSAPIRSGTERLPDVSDGRLNAMFHERFYGLIRNHRPDIVATEEPFIHWANFQPKQVRRWYQMLGVAHLCVYTAGLPGLREIHIGTYKKAFAGDGRAKKDEIVAECVRRGWDVNSEDEADARAILCCVLEIPRPFGMEATP